MLDVAKHLAVLTYGLCRPRRLPSLVTDIVAGYLDDPASIILVLSAVSKRLHQYAASVIYQEIKLDFQEDGRAVRKSALLSRTLRANEVAASSVRSLIFTGCIFPGSVRGHELEDLDSDNATQYVNALVDCASGDFSLNRARPMTLRASMSHASVPEFCCQILNLCREVRELTIASALLEYPGFYNIVGPGRPVTLQNLRTADFCIDLDTTHTEPYDPHLYVVKDWDATLLGLFSLLSR
ncbi:hypothetical protein B0A48_05024 [Cryoendolithus antarcticus]|uniref:Uncharacterized protein n=1 Tax=Cryoendolithus antarcticus TaxID=1507870 RepID=A0A1V8TEH8_9PEZI|nr:hypothetical protein B0A48_05024 [Cryoendolithus antarcticus]